MLVFDGIEMDVIHVSSEIRFIANGMLPKALLPDAAQALARLATGNGWVDTTRRWRGDNPVPRKRRVDDPVTG